MVKQNDGVRADATSSGRTMNRLKQVLFLMVLVLSACMMANERDKGNDRDGWIRYRDNPLFRDSVEDAPYEYEVASDPHVFFDESSSLHMIYTGDAHGTASIKLATGNSWTEWSEAQALLQEPNSAGTDIYISLIKMNHPMRLNSISRRRTT
jgi:hypothetical protein